jgi:hypothetical protein
MTRRVLVEGESIAVTAAEARKRGLTIIGYEPDEFGTVEPYEEPKRTTEKSDTSNKDTD